MTPFVIEIPSEAKFSSYNLKEKMMKYSGVVDLELRPVPNREGVFLILL